MVWLFSVGRDAPRWGVRKILDALEEGLRKVLEAAIPAPHCSSMVVRVAPFPFLILNCLAVAEEPPPDGPKTSSFLGRWLRMRRRNPPEPPGTPRNPLEICPGTPGDPADSMRPTAIYI